MMDYWEGRSMRERVLIVVAGALVTILLLNILVVKPLRTARAEAAASVAIAARTLDAVSASGPGAQSAGASNALALNGENLRAQLVELAAQRGLAVSRLQTSDKGAIIIQFDQASAPQLFAWLEAAERQTGARPAEVSIFAESQDGVRASFEFREGTS